jgi:hypothetical protein
MTRIPNLEELLKSDDLNSSIIDIDNFIGELCEYGDDYSKLTEQQKLFYFNQNLEREINNGGFNQYFYNSSGNYAHETVISLKEIGANKTADILQKAIDEFPNKNVPKDRDERIEVIEKIEDNANNKWEELDKQFYQYEDNLNLLNIEYIKKNASSF